MADEVGAGEVGKKITLEHVRDHNGRKQDVVDVQPILDAFLPLQKDLFNI